MKINFQKALLCVGVTLLVSNAKVNAQWSLSGNAAAGGNFIGTTNAVDFITKTNNIERMRVTAAGNVGVGPGATAPEDQLQVGYSFIKLVMGSAQGANLSYGTAYMGFNASRQQSSSTWSTSSDGGNNGGAVVFSNLVGSLFFSTLGTTGSANRTGITDATVAASSKLFIRGTDGQVGIGTTNPGYKLQVEGDIYANQGSIIVSKNSNEGGQLVIYNHTKTASGLKGSYAFYNMTGGYGNKLSLWSYPLSGNGNERFSVWDNGDFTFHNASSAATVHILNNGSVGIGVVDQSKLSITGYKLFVGGGIFTEKVKVATYANWADYVFASNYELKSLKEVEKFIQQNKHLPNIPSAKEVKEQGIDLAEMQAKQMEKIEELTLYLIQQQKEIELLKAANKK